MTDTLIEIKIEKIKGDLLKELDLYFCDLYFHRRVAKFTRCVEKMNKVEEKIKEVGIGVKTRTDSI